MAMGMWSGCSHQLTAVLLEYTNELLPVLAQSPPSSKGQELLKGKLSENRMGADFLSA